MKLPRISNGLKIVLGMLTALALLIIFKEFIMSTIFGWL
jgi:hypothetical protein